MGMVPVGVGCWLGRLTGRDEAGGFANGSMKGDVTEAGS